MNKIKQRKIIDPTVGMRIKYARQNLGYSQEYIADKAEITAKFLYELENGKKECVYPTIAKICRALYESSDNILFGDCDKTRLVSSLFSQIDTKEQGVIMEMMRVLIRQGNN